MASGVASFLPVSRFWRYERSSTGSRWVWSTGAPLAALSGSRFTVTQSPGTAVLSTAPLAAVSPSVYLGAPAKLVLHLAGVYRPGLKFPLLPSRDEWSVEPGQDNTK